MMPILLQLFCLSTPQSSVFCDDIRDQIMAWSTLADQLTNRSGDASSEEELVRLWNRVDEQSVPLRRLADLLLHGSQVERRLGDRLDQAVKRLGELDTVAEMQGGIHAVLAVLRDAGASCDAP